MIARDLMTGHSEDAVIDLVHLARQTAGDQDLELQLLDLFARRSAELLDKISHSLSNPVRCDMAHGLRGSALAVGAKRVAEAAATYEAVAARAADDAALALAYETLAGAVRDARGTIAAML